VLDAGCGTGLFLCQWRDSAGIPLAVGLDVFPAALRRARQRCNSTWVAGSAGALPFRAGSFDAIHSADVLQHLSLADSERAVDTFVELLRPGGWLVLRLRASRLFGNPPDVDESHSFRPRALRAALKSRGIEVVFLSRVNALPSLLAECAGFFRARPAASEPVQGIVCRQQSDPRSWLLDRYLSLERAWLLHSGFGLRFGHTLVCLARKPG
jgi:SAM-dependent methyltransferase